MNKILIPILAILLSGCASLASMPPKVSGVAYKEMNRMPEPENGKIILAVYQFADLTGQQKPNDNFGEMSKAVTQGASNLLIKALKDVGGGKWFRVAERESLQSLLQERKLIRTTRQMTQGDKAKPLGPMLYAGAYVTGGIVGYDSNTLTGGVGHRFLGIGASAQYRQDTVTVMLRLINVVSGEVVLAVMTEKTILSVGIGGDKFKYKDLDTKLLEIEAGVAKNEPVTYAVRKTIEGAVIEMIKAGEKEGLWKFKPPPLPPTPVDADEFAETPVIEKTEEITEEELLEVIEKDNEETRTEVKEEAASNGPDASRSAATIIVTPAPLPENVEEPVKLEEPISDDIVCESGPHHYRCKDISDEKTNTSTDPNNNNR
jgi:curli production assembly/transport component CsgG